MRINIIGAGMAGLLAANMLRRHDVVIYEKQTSLPNNHSAVLRFRTPNVGDILGIQFKKVNMMKTYVPYANIVADSISYSKKCIGTFSSDRSIIEGTMTSERYVAPPDLIDQMSKNVNIKYEINYNFIDSKIITISTIPMPILMDALEYRSHDIKFNWFSGIVATATIKNCNAFVSVLFPNPGIRASRATITGNQLIIEFPGVIIPETWEITEIYTHLGLFDSYIYDLEFKKQQYFKITEINDAERKKFQRWATVNHNIYSLGRYACWRPKLLLDDLIKDVKTIESWIVGVK
jgi:hypothetical protein